MSNTPSILFAISDTGGGHRSGATAICAAIEELVGSDVECHIVDLLISTGLPLVQNAPDIYDHLSTDWLMIYNTLFQMTNGRRRMDLLTRLVYFQAHRNIVRVLDETRPSLVVSVHPLINRLIGNARRTYRLSFRFATVVTDLVTLHSAWADPAVELCIVPTEEAYQLQRKRNLSEDKLVHTGFPVHPKFTNYAASKHKARNTLGIQNTPFTILLTSGGVGSGNMRDLVQEIHQAYPTHQLLVVTGKNTELREELENMNLSSLVHVYGFVDHMEVLMAASDIVVTKAGPGTLMETLAMRRPVIVTEAVGIQEQGNIDFVLNHELGAFCPTPERIVPAIADLMEPDVYEATMDRLADAVPRDGAIQIAHILLDQLHLDPPSRRRRLRIPKVDLRRFRNARLPLSARHIFQRPRNPKQFLRLSNMRRIWRRGERVSATDKEHDR
ncbi:MAG: glycosyltransferase [Chloroflexi bacterium AL-W]|nr:glycosyltransferase [Chloroflexi bacterium AL-N1]NOK69275.1 glycosyltransferase [Chloroflexi bacterium AL-N10]NOK76336.1 glycosyltransferase [Chloroflexi bacterium AL-N5]NOK83453.1 glycosyltransferase [Chloroflexi bacterium AL-W]NOK91113.1 glycosyltransferase [Chloroflexi bacterium AL-N15]